MSMKTTMIALAALAMSGTTHAITSEEIANALGVDPNIATFSLSGVAEWSADTNVFHGGAASLKSGTTGYASDWSRKSDISFVLDVKEPCCLKYWQRKSMYNDSYYEALFLIDNDITYTYTGSSDWQQISIVLMPGHHALTWSYRRRYGVSTSGVSYCAWIDDVTIEPVIPSSGKVEVTNIKCQQRYPWNGMVDIDYTVTSDDPNADVWVYPIGYDKDSNTSMAPRALTGNGVNAPVKAGTHRMTWTVTEDYPDFHSTAFTVKMIALVGAAPYMVVDLSGGVDALSYPVSYLSSVPEGGWGDEYKTTKLVLRLIPPGSFMMGSPSDELGRNSSEVLHDVVLSKPFYVGIFEVTQKQWEMVMGATPSNYKGDSRPVERVSYNDIRGSVNGAGWPTHNQVDANSFMGRMRSKVNMFFDLPTEAQWEYACRAGTSTALNSGKNLTQSDSCVNMAEVGRYTGNNNDGKGGFNGQHTKVGSYMPNVWGIYDMHGNVWELCRDWYGDLSEVAVVDPVGASSGSCRVGKGGSFYGYNDYGKAMWCRSAVRSSYSFSGWSSCSFVPSSAHESFGFRVMCSPVAE